MKCGGGWGYKPYIPYDRYGDYYKPYICRLAPGENSAALEWVDNGKSGKYRKYRVLWAKEGLSEYESAEVSVDASGALKYTIEGLDAFAGYKCLVEAENGERSPTRLFRTGDYPGVVVNYLHPRDMQYAFSGRHTCSPSIVKLDSGRLLVSMDIFDGSAPQNLTLVYFSDDMGKTWSYLTDIFPCFWGTLFTHRGALYLMGISTEYGDLLIGRSDDRGASWNTPTVLMRGSADTVETGPHRAPMPVCSAKGRLWTAIEYGSWTKRSFAAAVFSIDENDDLTIAENWHHTGFLPTGQNLPGATPGVIGAIEGNAVEAPDGSIRDIMRYCDNRALVLDIKGSDELPVFSHFADCPFAHSKFEIKRHKNGKYYAVGNRLPLRTVLSVFVSDDLESWEVISDIENRMELPPSEVGFQYPAFVFDGDELLVAVRTAYNGAENFHDSNLINFYRVKI